MDDKDFDQLIDVPDTPDRLSARLRSHTSGKECISSRVGCLHNSGSLNRGRQDLQKDEVRVVDRTGPSRRPFIRPPKRIGNANESVECSNTFVLSPSHNPCNSQGHSRRIKTDRNSDHDHRRISSASYDILPGKELRSAAAYEDGAAMRSNAGNVVHETTFPFRESKQFGDKCRKAEGEANGDYSHHPSNSFQRIIANPVKGKEKVGESICRGNGSAMGHGKESNLPSVFLNINNERKSPKRFLEPHDVSSPRAVKQRRLVRNGCISPHNIATKTIQLAGENNNNLKNFGTLVLDEVSRSSQSRPEEKELTRDGNGGRDKGKGILHLCSSRDHGARSINSSTRNPVITGVDTARQADVIVEDFNESQNSWRSTRNNTNNMVHSNSTLRASHHRRGSLTGSSIMTCKDIPEKTNHLCVNQSSRSNVLENMEAVQGTSRLAPSSSAAVRRQTRSGLRGRNDIDHDSVVLLDDSPVLSLARRPNHRSNPSIEVDEFSPEMRQSVSERAGPSVPYYLDDATARQMEACENMEAVQGTSRLAPSSSAAVRRQTRSGLRCRNDVDHDSVVLLDDSPVLSLARRPNHCSNPSIEVDEFSPEMRQSVSERAGPSVSNYLDDATARQMEADEILARELQEQLYNESLSNEFVAQILHEDQNHVAPTNAVGHRRSSFNRGTSTTRARRQPQPELRQGLSSFRRRGRINATMRSQQPRASRQTSRRPSFLLSRERGSHFPPDMDLDMRIDVLEALEAALGDMDGIVEASSNIFQMQRDFNENDYEMLLALDQNVHQAGASSRQINNLPESKIQSNTMCEETCAICLENPAIGETIRHLPCFHKFHKDCIDPWLNRSTSCPVCKSSIA